MTKKMMDDVRSSLRLPEWNQRWITRKKTIDPISDENKACFIVATPIIDDILVYHGVLKKQNSMNE